MATSALIAQILHLYWVYKDMVIVKWYNCVPKSAKKTSNCLSDILKYVRMQLQFWDQTIIFSSSRPLVGTGWTQNISLFLFSFRNIRTSSLSLHHNFIFFCLFLRMNFTHTYTHIRTFGVYMGYMGRSVKFGISCCFTQQIQCAFRLTVQ